MPVADLSHITRTYIEVIRRGFVNSLAWTGPVPDILPVSPVNLNIEGLGFYLYHVIEKKEYGNVPVPNRDPQMRFLPMALSLNYQLTANSILEDENGPFNEQLMMSIAMKALHDCPMIDDTTLTPNNTTPVMDPNILGSQNRFRIVQEPVPFSDAVRNWTAGQSAMKLSAYYEVSIIFLQPDELQSYSGRVLLYGNYVFLKGAPRINSIYNTISITIPGETAAREIKIQPAQAPAAPPPPAIPPPSSIITVSGAGFEGGSVTMRLLNPRFKESVIADADWNISLTSLNTMSATVREKAILERNNTQVDILPGMYATQIVVSKTLQLPNGLSKEFKNASNQFPFIISPRIDIISVPSGTVVTVTGYIFQYMVGPDDILEDAIEVYAAESRLLRNSGGIFNPGEFRVTSTTQMEVNIPGPLSAGMRIPLRIMIDGAESLPAWISI